MHISVSHIAIGMALLSSLLMSATIIFRRANGMIVNRVWLHLRTASWGLLGFTIALAIL